MQGSVPNQAGPDLALEAEENPVERALNALFLAQTALGSPGECGDGDSRAHRATEAAGAGADQDLIERREYDDSMASPYA